jgi:hypothetical protein
MTAPARIAAYYALRAVADERADLPSALARGREHLSDERDRALAAEIVTGTLRWQRSFDHLVEHFANRRLAKVDRSCTWIASRRRRSWTTPWTWRGRRASRAPQGS